MSQEKRDHMWSSFHEELLEEKVGKWVSGILRNEHEREPSPVKRISQRTGIAPATIRKWYTGKKPPSIGHFLLLAQNYPEVVKAFLEVSGHGYLRAYVQPATGAQDGDRTPPPTDVFRDISNVPKNVHDVHDLPNETLNERQEWFLIRLRETGDARAEDIAGYFPVSIKTAWRDIEGLKMAGKIRFVGAARTGRYQIIDK